MSCWEMAGEIQEASGLDFVKKVPCLGPLKT